MNQPPSPHGNSAQGPALVRNYAAYLRAKAQVTPETTVSGDRAEVRASVGDSVLVLVFRCSSQDDWSLRRAEVQRGEQTATFACGQVVQASAALLGHEPQNPEGQTCLLTSI
jgi:hypothetical protein